MKRLSLSCVYCHRLKTSVVTVKSQTWCVKLQNNPCLHTAQEFQDIPYTSKQF